MRHSRNQTLIRTPSDKSAQHALSATPFKRRGAPVAAVGNGRYPDAVIEPRTDSALRAIRRLLRAARLSEKQLAEVTGLTPSQLLVLQEVERRGETTAGVIATTVRFSQATVTTIVDRLTERGFVVRSRRETDRRQVWVSATTEGMLALSSAPDMMQDQFQDRFEQLAEWEQAMIVAMLERLTTLFDADQIDAAPVIFAGAIDRTSPAE